MRWRARDRWWRVLYRLIVVSLWLLNAIRFLAFGVAVLAHRAHVALAEFGQVTAETLSAHGDYAAHADPDPDPYRRLTVVAMVGRGDVGGRF